jgi:Mrp family chromosome partitioning ATPase
MPGRRAHTVLVTSAEPNEGKTTTALNLAMAAAQSGRRVVLVDSDMRRSALRLFLGSNGRKGLSDCLIGQVELADVLQSALGTNLRLLSAGTRATTCSARTKYGASPSRARAGGRSSSLCPLRFGRASCWLCDAVLMVCVPGASHRRAVQRASALLNQSGCAVSGMVLNKVEQNRGRGYYGYYHSYGDGAGDGAGVGTPPA